jgi:hypothetical protein
VAQLSPKAEPHTTRRRYNPQSGLNEVPNLAPVHYRAVGDGFVVHNNPEVSGRPLVHQLKILNT